MKNTYELMQLLDKKYQELKFVENIEFRGSLSLNVLLSKNYIEEDLFIIGIDKEKNVKDVIQSKKEALEHIRKNGYDSLTIGYSSKYINKYITDGLIDFISTFDDIEKNNILLKLKKYYIENCDFPTLEDIEQLEDDDIELYDDFESKIEFLEYVEDIEDNNICFEFENNEMLSYELIENYMYIKEECIYLDNNNTIDKEKFTFEERSKQFIIDLYNSLLKYFYEPSDTIYKVNKFLNDEISICESFIKDYIFDEEIDSMKDKIKLILINEYCYNIINNKDMNSNNLLYLNIFNKMSIKELIYTFYNSNKFSFDITKSFIDNNKNNKLGKYSIHK